MPRIPNDVISMLQAYAWPGNVRELQNYIESCLQQCSPSRDADDGFVSPADVSGMVLAPMRISRAKSGGIQKMCSELVTLGLLDAGDDAQNVHEKIVSLVEKEVLLQVLRTCQGTQTKAAVRLDRYQSPTLCTAEDRRSLQPSIRNALLAPELWSSVGMR